MNVIWHDDPGAEVIPLPIKMLKCVRYDLRSTVIAEYA